MLTSFASCCCVFLFLDEQNPLVMWPLSAIIIKRIKIQFELLSLHNAKFNTTEGWFYWFSIGYSMEISYLDTNMVLAVEGTNGLAPAPAHFNFIVSSIFHKEKLCQHFYLKALFIFFPRSLQSWNYLQLKQQYKIYSLGRKICVLNATKLVKMAAVSGSWPYSGWFSLAPVLFRFAFIYYVSIFF